jgi:ribosomal protein L11 methyltransferase
VPSAFVRVRIRSPVSERDRLAGELFALGTSGIEERDPELWAYFAGAAPLEALRALARSAAGIAVADPEPVPAEDWSARAREGLAPRRVGALWIRPSWCASAGEPELVVDPAQGFGSGEHASTRLALALLLEALEPGDRVLDAGTGSGILALAALRSGAAGAVGFDTDGPSCLEARANARRNALRLPVFRGTRAAIAPGARFDVVVANLLLHEVLPDLPGLARHAARALVVSGYLEEQRMSLVAAMQAADPSLRQRSARTEPQSGDRWCASLWSRP